MFYTLIVLFLITSVVLQPHFLHKTLQCSFVTHTTCMFPIYSNYYTAEYYYYTVKSGMLC